MRLLITSLPGYGHLCPLIPLARAVQAAGHEVAFATASSTAHTLIPADLTVFGCGPDWSETDFSHDTAIKAHSAIELPLHKYLAEIVVPRMLTDVMQVVDRWQPDIILSNEYERTGCVVAEKYEIPFVLVSAGPRVSRALRQRWQVPLYALSRELAGLSDNSPIDYLFKWLHLYLTPLDYAFEQNYEAADNEFAVRVNAADISIASKEIFDSSIVDKNRKRILCTFGTVFNKNSSLLDTIINGMDTSSYQMMVTAGSPGSVQIADRTSDVIVFPTYIPLSELMPYVDACVTHGGTSTLLTVLQYAKPLLLLPQGADQQVNAMTCARLGLAECIFNSMPQAINVEVGKTLLEAESVRVGIDKLFSTPAIKSNCLEMQAQFRRLPDLNFAVDLLDRLANTKTPLNRFDIDIPRT